MYRIKFRCRKMYGNRVDNINPVVTCLSKFPTKASAEKQIAKWAQVFPNNAYYLERV